VYFGRSDEQTQFIKLCALHLPETRTSQTYWSVTVGITSTLYCCTFDNAIVQKLGEFWTGPSPGFSSRGGQ